MHGLMTIGGLHVAKALIGLLAIVYLVGAIPVR
jgi:hypothetical protein